MRLKLFLLFFLSFASLPAVLAHCPLCTAGAAVAAGGAAYLGVNNSAIGVFLGAFAVSMGLWFSRLIKKKFIPQQRNILVLLSYLTTILPLRVMFKDIRPLMVNSYGAYGSFLNRTYLIDSFIIFSLLGGMIVIISPFLSKKITELRKGNHLPYQGILLMFVLLLITALILQFTL